MDGLVVIGEGEKDRAPMLCNGELVGNDHPPSVDLAVDPLEGTRLQAHAAPNAIAVIAAAERGTMWSPGPGFYTDKLVVGEDARGSIDIAATPAENLSQVAKALGKDIRELVVFVLDKPRHQELVAEIRDAGAAVRLVTDGDVVGALLAAMPGTGIDVLMGVGGTPEGLISACAVRALGGEVQCRLAPQSARERARVIDAGLDPSAVLPAEQLVGGEDAFFVATGVTRADLLPGFRVEAGRATTWSLVTSVRPRTLRLVETIHRDASGERGAIGT